MESSGGMSWNRTAPNCLFVFISQLINLVLDDIYWFCHLLDYMVGWWSRIGNGHKCFVVFIPWFDDGGLIQDYICVFFNCEIKLWCVSSLCWPLLIKHTVILFLCIVKMVSIIKVQIWPVYELLKPCVIAYRVCLYVYCDFEIKSKK